MVEKEAAAKKEREAKGKDLSVLLDGIEAMKNLSIKYEERNSEFRDYTKLTFNAEK